MILIFSRPTDETTIQLIQWLNSINKEFFRINTIKDFDLCNINNSNLLE